jgi:hypothetical protein
MRAPPSVQAKLAELYASGKAAPGDLDSMVRASAAARVRAVAARAAVPLG